MSRKVLMIALVIGLAAALIGGSTMAWFTAKAEVENEFTAGTVMIEAGSNVSGDVDINNWNPGDCTELKLDIQNIGSKKIRLRTKNGAPRGYETAMARMKDDPNDFTFKWENHPWFTYVEYIEFDLSEGGKTTYYFYAAQTQRVGEVDVWKTDGNLNIEVRLDSGYEMSESHAIVQLNADAYQPPAQFGRWPYKKDHEPAVSNYTYQIPWEEEWDNAEVLYIAVHAVVYGEYSEGSVTGKKGEWAFNWEWLWENWNALCFSTRGCETLNAAYEAGVSYADIKDTIEWQDFVGYAEMQENPVSVKLCDSTTDWALQDGYFYYTGAPIMEGETVELCLKVCFDGDLGTNVFQGASYKLSLNFEAVQASNEAPSEVWGVDFY